jgi:hypothetical protein
MERGLNEVVADGALVARADYPRLWEFGANARDVTEDRGRMGKRRSAAAVQRLF